MELEYRKHLLKDQQGQFQVSTAFLPQDQISLGGKAACTVAALYLTEAIHHLGGWIGILSSSEHYSQLWQLAVHKWKKVLKAMYTAITTYGEEFPEGYYPVPAAIEATGLPIKELFSKTCLSVDLGSVSAPLKSWGLDTSACELLRELISGPGPAHPAWHPQGTSPFRHFVLIHRRHSFLLSSKGRCNCGLGGHDHLRCTSVMHITDSLGTTLVENGKQGYVMTFDGSGEELGCALDAALRALQWRFAEHYDVGELKNVTCLGTLYQGLAVEISEVAYDRVAQAALASPLKVVFGQSNLQAAHEAAISTPYLNKPRPCDDNPSPGFSTPTKQVPSLHKDTRSPTANPSTSSASPTPLPDSARSPVRASPRQAAKERSRLFSTWTTVHGRRRASLSSPSKPPSCKPPPIPMQNTFEVLLRYEVGDVPEAPDENQSPTTGDFIFAQILSKRHSLFRLPVIPTESLTSFQGRVAKRFKLPQAAGLRPTSHGLSSADMAASFESTSVKPGDTVEFEAYVKCGRKNHLQPISLFSIVRGGRLSQACFECDRSGRSGEVREGAKAFIPTMQADIVREAAGAVPKERWCTGCRSFKDVEEFSGKKSCATCQVRVAKRKQERAERKAAQKHAVGGKQAAETANELPRTDEATASKSSPGVVSSSAEVKNLEEVGVASKEPAAAAAAAPDNLQQESRKREMPAQVMTFNTEESFQAWLNEQETTGGIDLLLRRDEPSTLVDTGHPSFGAEEPSTWVAKTSAKIRSNATLRYREFKCMCHGKSKSKSSASESKFKGLSKEADKAQGEAETAQDRLLRLAKEDVGRSRRQARRGLDVKFSNNIDCKYRFTVTTAVTPNMGPGGITLKIFGSHLPSCGEANSYRGLDKGLRIWIKMLLDLGCSPGKIIDYINTPSTLPNGIPPPPIPFQGINCEKVHPRWSPQEKDVENMLQSIRRGKYLDLDDQKATYEFLKKHCQAAIESTPAFDPPVQDFDVLEYQEFQCHCHEGSASVDISTQGTGRIGKARLKSKVQKKKCEHGAQCRPFIAVLQSSWQRQVLKDLHSKRLADVFCLDATGQTNQYRWPLSALVLPDEEGHAIPVAFMLSSTEREEPLEVFFRAAFQMCPLTFKPRAFSIDMSDVEINAIRKVFGDSVDIRVCFFHVMQAWERWLKRSVNRVSEQQKIAILRMIRQMKLAPSLESWQKAYDFLVAYLNSEDLEQVLVHLRRDWIGSENRQVYRMWCNAFRTKRIRSSYRIETNNLVERFFKTLKWRFLEGKNNKRLKQVLQVLTIQVRNFYVSRRKHVLAKRKANWKLYETVLDKEKKALALSEIPGAVDILDVQSGHAHVASKAALQRLTPEPDAAQGRPPGLAEPPGKLYTVVLRGGFCDCEDQSGLLCKHIRAVARKLGGLEKWNLNLDSHREEVLMEVKSAEMEQQSENNAAENLGGVESDLEEGYEEGVAENERVVLLRREVHDVLDRVCNIEPWADAKRLLKEVQIRVTADLRQEERTLRAKSFTQSKKKKGGVKRKRAADEKAATKVQDAANIAAASKRWTDLHVAARPKRAKQADHPKQSEDLAELSRLAAELKAKNDAAEAASPTRPVRSREESVKRFKERKKRKT